MACQRGRPLIAAFSVLLVCALLAVAADPPTPQPLATLDVAKLLREDCRNAKGNFHFERTVRYRRSKDENQEVLE